MIINHRQEKIINALTYLLEKTSWYGKTKLYKMLFLLDFEHFKQTGRSVTGFDYFAWRMGPVPTELHEAIETGAEIIVENFRIENQEGKNGNVITYLHPKRTFDPKYLTARELEILKGIANTFDLATGNEMVWFTHQETYPWYKVWEIEKKHQKLIPYEYALDDLDETDRQVVLDIAQERQAFLEKYQ